jgi:hypothetical protein
MIYILSNTKFTPFTILCKEISGNSFVGFPVKLKPVPFQLSHCNITNRSINNTWILETDEDRNKFLDLLVLEKGVILPPLTDEKIMI